KHLAPTTIGKIIGTLERYRLNGKAQPEALGQQLLQVIADDGAFRSSLAEAQNVYEPLGAKLATLRPPEWERLGEEQQELEQRKAGIVAELNRLKRTD